MVEAHGSDASIMRQLQSIEST